MKQGILIVLMCSFLALGANEQTGEKDGSFAQQVSRQHFEIAAAYGEMLIVIRFRVGTAHPTGLRCERS